MAVEEQQRIKPCTGNIPSNHGMNASSLPISKRPWQSLDVLCGAGHLESIFASSVTQSL